MALAIVSGAVIAADIATQRAGLPEPGLLGVWIGWAIVGLSLGAGLTLVGIVRQVARKISHVSAANKLKAAQAEASRLHDETRQRDIMLARRNIATLNRDERLLLMDALKRHPYHLEVLEFGAGGSLT